MAMDIFKRPPNISEDTLQYFLYPASESADRSSVTSLAAVIQAYVKELLPSDFIWHRDSFELEIVRDPHASSLSEGQKDKDKWMLEGRMRVGDCVDDEWCVVWLLCEVSKKCDVAVTVYDSDGDFLLIEAAEYLPSWVAPDNSENRVWLYRGNLHLIPLSYLSARSTKPKQRRKLGGHESDEGENFLNEEEEEGWLNVQDALKALRSAAPTKAPKEVQDAVWKRIAGYPGAARQHIHVAKAFVPVDVAKALSKEPSLVQRAVETFYTRDAIQLRAAHKMARFPPQTSVLSPIRMTRTAYAQLVGQKFHSPKIFGQFKEREGTREWWWRDIGMKIACGFEMLYQESKSRSESLSSEALKSSAEARKDALRRNPEYIEYVKRLRSSGYFKDEAEGSQLWTELEDRAAEMFVNSKRDNDISRPAFATLVNTAIAQAGENPMLPELEEDSDDWLNINAESFDAKLEETMRSKAKPRANNQDVIDVDQPVSVEDQDQENRVAQAQAEKLKGLAKKIETFVEGEGSLEGAVFEDEKMSDDEKLSELSDEEFPSGAEDNKDSETEEFEVENAAEKAARQDAMDRLVPALDPSEYGKMPPEYYSNSQRMAPVTMRTERREDTSFQTSSMSLAQWSDGTNESVRRTRPIRRPILPRDKYDGVDSDDETDEGDEEEEEDRPQVVGEVEIDMGEEQEEFLEFSRTTLGISDEMWDDILRDRRSRGAYVPKGMQAKQSRSKEQIIVSSQEQVCRQKPDEERRVQLRSGRSGPQPNANPNLDSFEAVMEAMEAELKKAQLAKKSSNSSQRTLPKKLAPAFPPEDDDDTTSLQVSKGKGKEEATDEDIKMDDEDEDIESAMDVELRAALEREEGDSGDEEPMDYGMIKNFLESFKSQGGLAGPVSMLAGRLDSGWLPRDESQ